MITHNPLHGSGQADFPHPALALGDNAHASQGIGMTDGRQWQPASDEAPHTVPEDAFCCGRFPLASPPPSIPSATGSPALFGDFSGTTGLSDFPGPFVIGVRP